MTWSVAGRAITGLALADGTAVTGTGVTGTGGNTSGAGNTGDGTGGSGGVDEGSNASEGTTEVSAVTGGQDGTTGTSEQAQSEVAGIVSTPAAEDGAGDHSHEAAPSQSDALPAGAVQVLPQTGASVSSWWMSPWLLGVSVAMLLLGGTLEVRRWLRARGDRVG